MIVAALLAVGIVVSVTIDLGPVAREAAETAGSKAIERPIHIGRLAIHLLTGRFVVEDLVIDGRHEGDPPFFTAKQLSVALNWSTAIQRKPEFTVTSVQMTDWSMIVEKWPNEHNFPKIARDNTEPQQPRPFTVTLRDFHASGGRFTYLDHSAKWFQPAQQDISWSIICRNLELNIGNLPQYHGEAAFSGGTVQIQQYAPMWANMHAAFTLDGSHVRLSRIDRLRGHFSSGSE